jgi:hypothetical protein
MSLVKVLKYPSFTVMWYDVYCIYVMLCIGSVVDVRTGHEKCSSLKVSITGKLALKMKMTVFWVVAQCSLVEVYHHQGDRPDDGGSKDL